MVNLNYLSIISLNLLLSSNISFSLVSKFGDGGKVNEQSEFNSITDFLYMENLLDINANYGDNIYLYTQ